MKRFQYKIAELKHNQELKELLHKNPMSGEISVAFETEPNYFDSVNTGNESSRTIICEEAHNKKIVALMAYSIKKVFINGKPAKIGYLNNLRVDKNYRGQGIISNAWDLFYKIHQQSNIPFYLTSIIKDNYQAKNALLKKKFGRPQFIKICNYTTYIINLLRNKKEMECDIQVVRAKKNNISEIVECLNRNGKQKQFYPFYSKEDFFNIDKLRDFKIENFFIAKKNDKIVGVIGAWEQTGFKQAVINSYNGKMKLIKPVFNICSKICNFSPLPPANQPMKFIYASFIAIDNNNSDTFRQLLISIHNYCLKNKYLYLTLGLSDLDPLSKIAREFFSIKYASEIFLVKYPDLKFDISKLDEKVPYIELATL